MGGGYFGYIAGSYAITVLIFGWMIGASLVAHSRARARLSRIEAEGREGRR